MKKIPVFSPEMISNWYAAEIDFDFSKKASNEALVNLSNTSIFSNRYYAHSDGLNFPYKKQLTKHTDIYVRESVASALLIANQNLKEMNLELVVLDGYRNLPLQECIWNFFRKEISGQNPLMEESEIIEHTSVYCWNPGIWNEIEPLTWPVHMTGGSVDVTLRRLNDKSPLYMGTVFDDSSELAHTDAYEKILQSMQSESSLTTSDKAALEGRRILYNIMVASGFSSYWGEWWHYDIGTQLSARSKFIKGEMPISFYPFIDFDLKS